MHIVTDKPAIQYAEMDDLPVIHLCLFGRGLVVNSAPARQSGLGPHTYIDCVNYHSLILFLIVNDHLLFWFFTPFIEEELYPAIRKISLSVVYGTG
jgi:hypothetical protein